MTGAAHHEAQAALALDRMTTPAAATTPDERRESGPVYTLTGEDPRPPFFRDAPTWRGIRGLDDSVGARMQFGVPERLCRPRLQMGQIGSGERCADSPQHPSPAP